WPRARLPGLHASRLPQSAHSGAEEEDGLLRLTGRGWPK
ncbi:hypothetical protein SOVF_187940, partial [Spinacia oleracea]